MIFSPCFSLERPFWCSLHTGNSACDPNEEFAPAQRCRRPLDKEGVLLHQGLPWVAAIVLPFASPGCTKHVYYCNMFQLSQPAPCDRKYESKSSLFTKKTTKRCQKLPPAVVTHTTSCNCKSNISAFQLNSSLFYYNSLLLPIYFQLIYLSSTCRI